MDGLSKEEATKLLRLFVRDGCIEYSGHCLRDSMQKRNIDMQDVENVLMHGEILRRPDWDDQYQNWKYRVEGVDLEDDELTAITVIFQEERTVLVLTVF